MAYADKDGQVTFIREAGDNFLDPEKYVCTCQGCDKVVKGRVQSRSLLDIAKKHEWVLLRNPQTPLAKGWLYCSPECANTDQPSMVEAYSKHLRDMSETYAIMAAGWEL